MRDATVRDVRSFLLPILTLVLLALSLGSLGVVWAGEAPPAESGVAPAYPVYGRDVYPGAGEPQPRFRRPIREFFQWAKTNLEDTDPFFRDTVLNLHVRTYYRGVQTTTEGVSQEAWAAGGWLEYKSGWWLDTVQVGGTLFGTGPIYAPENRDGTKLLKPGQDGFVVPGIAYGALRYKEYATLTGFRQYVDTPYINRQDNRMIPRTNEGMTVGGKLGILEYFGGYLWTHKERDSDVFKSFSEVAGVPGKDRGTVVGNAKLSPLPGLTFTLHDSYTPDIFNTFYVDGEYAWKITPEVTLRVGGQYTDQRSVGQDLTTSSFFKEWATNVGGGHVMVTYKGATLEGAISLTGPGNTIQAPFGSYPGYISQLFNDFNRANEKAWLLGVAYDFKTVGLPGFTANFEYSQGTDAIDPKTRAAAPNEREYNLSLSYKVLEGALRGLSFDAKGAILDLTNSGRTGLQLRLIANYEFNLL
jgi:outer membrane porin, OprD family